MTRVSKLLYLAISIPVFIVLIWFFAVPDSLIKTIIEDSISNRGRPKTDISIKGLKKGLFFTVHVDNVKLNIDNTPALIITDISSKLNPLQLFRKQLAFSVKGKIGTGNFKGYFRLPVRPGESDESEKGNLKIDNVELSAVPYLASVGIEGKGLISAELNLKNNTVDVSFKIPDANIKGSVGGMPLPIISSFHKIQGAFSLEGNVIRIKSISLEGDRGYARLKGNITNEYMNLVLELMPYADELKAVESMLIGQYQISPGHYVIPINGPLM